MSNNEILEKPMTIKQIKKITNNGEKYLTCNVIVSLSSIIESNHEGFLDLLSNLSTGTDILMDVNYSIFSGKGNELVIQVTGDVSGVLEIEE